MKEVFLFELRFRLRQPSTYIFFTMLFALSVLIMASDALRNLGDGRVMPNAPYLLVTLGNSLVLFGSLIVTALMGTSIYRDFEARAHELFFTTRLTKWEYLLGRFLGSYTITLLVFLALPLGFIVGTSLPGRDVEFAPFRLDAYLSLIGVFLMPNLFLLGAMFFVLGSLTRSLLAIYVQAIILFVLYAIAQILLQNVENRDLAVFLEPFGVGAATQVTRYWSQFEKNQNLLPLDGLILYNRLFWTAIAVAILALGYRLFAFASNPIVVFGGRWSVVGGRKGERSNEENFGISAPLSPPSDQSPTTDHRPPLTATYLRLTRFYFRDIVRGIPFWMTTGSGVILLIVIATQANKVFDTSVYPVTRIIMEALASSFVLFMLILSTFYAGELTWRERVLGVDQITDTLPVPTPVMMLSKVSALLLVLFLLNTFLVVAGVIIQAVQGYFRFELGLYFVYLFLYYFPTLILLNFMTFFIHALVNQKFIGHTVVILLFLSAIILSAFKLERNLYTIGGSPSVVYSDMNGFGPFAEPIFWFTLYWFSIMTFLLMLGIRLWVRGKEERLSLRWKQGRMGTVGAGVALLSALTAIGSGCFIFYNTDILNKYLPKAKVLDIQADYEKQYKAAWERKPQPRVTDVTLDVDLRPEIRNYTIKGRYRLKNKTKQPIPEIVVDINSILTVKELKFGVPTTSGIVDTRTGFRSFKLASPLKPGEETTLDFVIAYDKRGFTNDNPMTAIAGNGTFLTMPGPVIGYQKDGEITSESDRKDRGLSRRQPLPPATDMVARQNSYIGVDGDWVQFEATIRTAPDQIAIAPGYLQKEWTENGRRCFHYKMDAPIRNFYSFLSARYAVKKDTWTGKDGKTVALEIYYHPTHTFNLSRMMDGMKAALTYCTENFSPYQYRQLRIVEFPVYAQFAQSFPNTIPYSEGIGFIAKVNDNAEDIDYPFYVTAHETAHQWWAHQVIGGAVEGSTMLSESLAEYTALKVMEKRFGPNQVRRFLRYDLDQYLEGRSKEGGSEYALIEVQNQPYIHYQKGALVFYAVADRIGTQRLNATLARFIEDNGFGDPPYPTSQDLLDYIRADSPREVQRLLTDLFEHITFYDLRTSTAKAVKRANGKWRVTLTVTAEKSHSDDSGKLTRVKLNDVFDIGIFAKPTHHSRNREALGKPLLLKPVRMTESEQTFTFDVSEEPAKAGIDPYNKMIDRWPDGNTIVVEKGRK